MRAVQHGDQIVDHTVGVMALHQTGAPFAPDHLCGHRGSLSRLARILWGCLRSGGAVLRSDDAGTTWARVQNPFSAVAVGCLMFRALAPVLAASTAQSAGKLDALVSRIAQAYGGEKALARIKAFRETGTLESPRGVARTVRVFAAPDRLRVEIVYPGGGAEVRVVDGRDGWSRYRPGQSSIGSSIASRSAERRRCAIA